MDIFYHNLLNSNQYIFSENYANTIILQVNFENYMVQGK